MTVGGPPAQRQDPRSVARALTSEGRLDEAWELLAPDLRAGDEYRTSQAAARVLAAGVARSWSPGARRTVRVAVLATYELAELSRLFDVACRAHELAVDLHVPPFGQVEQEALAAESSLKRFGPTHIVLAPCEQDLELPEWHEDPEAVVDAVVTRWTGLWAQLRPLHARVVQHAFVLPDVSPHGHLAASLPGSRLGVVREANRRLAQAAAEQGVLLVDCERAAARMGKESWHDARLWHATRQPCGYAALAALARETARVLAADVGLRPKCLVIDLDNTVWGGIVGEVGPRGVAVGDGPDGEAYAAFQDFLKAVRRSGVLLAVSSKNDMDAARAPFADHPGMRLRVDDFAAFMADWRPKSEQIFDLSGQLSLAPDDLVLLDDNPAECWQVARAVPGLKTVVLDGPPADFPARVASRVLLEATGPGNDTDRLRARSYAGRAEANCLRAAMSLSEFWRSLEMTASVRPVDRQTLERAAQLTQKTNQFNLTLRRRTAAELEPLLDDVHCTCLTLALRDRFADHGVVGLGVARHDADDTVWIDTLLLSCRVIGRTAEHHLLAHVSRDAAARGASELRGSYVAGPRNQLVAGLYTELGFVRAGDVWVYDLDAHGPIASPHIKDANP